MTVSRFKVFASGGKFNGQSEATVSIDRSNNFFMVRPKRMRRVYEMRLEDLAELVVWRAIKHELAEKKKAKAAARKARR